MTVIAGIATGDMREILAGGSNAIVTGAATTDHLGVIDRIDRHPDVGVMAVFANIARLNMCEVLTGCVRAIVAISTVVRNVRVIEIRR